LGRNQRPADLDRLARGLRRLARDQDRRCDRAYEGDGDHHQDRDLKAVEEGVRRGLVESVREPRPASRIEVGGDPERCTDRSLCAVGDRPGIPAGRASARRLA
jgi:hypothetical protein